MEPANQETPATAVATEKVAAPEGLDTKGIVAPTKDTRYKTEDVTGTKGLTFADFGLAKEVQLGIYEMGFEMPSPI